MKKLIIVTIFALFGCAHKPIIWDNQTHDNSHFIQDEAGCRMEGQKAQATYASGDLINTINVIQNANEVYFSCMQSKGYNKSQESTPQQASISIRYKQSVELENNKQKPISDYIVNNCRPLSSVEYIQCLNSKNAEYNSTSIFPDISKQFFNERKEYENQLIRKEISRFEFKQSVEKLLENMNTQRRNRIQQDIKVGVYTGKY